MAKDKKTYHINMTIHGRNFDIKGNFTSRKEFAEFLGVKEYFLSKYGTIGKLDETITEPMVKAYGSVSIDFLLQMGIEPTIVKNWFTYAYIDNLYKRFRIVKEEGLKLYCLDTFCAPCESAQRILTDYRIPYKLVKVGDKTGNIEILQDLMKISGVRTVPQLFLGVQFVASKVGDILNYAQANGKKSEGFTKPTDEKVHTTDMLPK